MHSVSESTEPVESRRPGRKSSWVSWVALLAIVGIIAAVLIPSYADYTHRTQNSEAIALMAGAKIPLAEYFTEHKKWPESLDKVAGATSGKFTASVRITKGAGGAGDIELTAIMRTEGVDRRVAGMTVLMGSADGGKTWSCKPGTMLEKHLPASCRTTQAANR